MGYIQLAKVDPQETEFMAEHPIQTELINSFQGDFRIKKEISFSLWMVRLITYKTCMILTAIFSSI